MLSPALGSVAVVSVAVLGLEDVDIVVLFTVVLDVVDVLVGAAAGFCAGFAVDPVVGSPTAGLAES